MVAFLIGYHLRSALSLFQITKDYFGSKQADCCQDAFDVAHVDSPFLCILEDNIYLKNTEGEK